MAMVYITQFLSGVLNKYFEFYYKFQFHFTAATHFDTALSSSGLDIFIRDRWYVSIEGTLIDEYTRQKDIGRENTADGLSRRLDDLKTKSSEFQERTTKKLQQMNALHFEFQERTTEKLQQMNAFQERITEKLQQMNALHFESQERTTEKLQQMNALHFEFQERTTEKLQQMNALLEKMTEHS